MRWLELRIPPVAVALIHGIGMWVLSGRSDPGVLRSTSVGWAAGALVVLGAMLALTAVAQFRSHKTTVDPRDPEASSTIVTTGVYRFSRNPMYLAFSLILAGWSLYLAQLQALMLVPVFVLYMTRFQIRPEERVLEERFGSEYVQYSSEVRRWV